MTICHKLDVVPDLLVVHAHKPDIYPYLLAAITSGSQNTRISILMACSRNLVALTGGDDNYLQESGIEPCQRVPVDYSEALMAALYRIAAID